MLVGNSISSHTNTNNESIEQEKMDLEVKIDNLAIT